MMTASHRKLLTTAGQARKRAYAVYSKYPVGAAILAGGKIFSGANVENGCYNLGMCAERVAAFTAAAAGERRFKAVAIAAKSAKPCGACRQVLIEFSGPDTALILADDEGVRVGPIHAMLPEPFNPKKAGLL